MWEWMKDNVTTLQVVVSVVSTGVWIAYLHVFLASFKRQTRSSLLITRAGGRGMVGRCIVSNMGSEPAYLLDVLAEFGVGDTKTTVSVVDRLELWDKASDVTTGVSAVGPIGSGGYVDIGSFDDLFARARKRLGSTDAIQRTDALKLVAIAATNQARHLVAAYRSFEIHRGDDGAQIRIIPVEVEAVQIRSRRMRKKLVGLLSELQRNEALDRDVLSDVAQAPGGSLSRRQSIGGIG
ncbi:hypothetical protein [Salipiger aestuarii]|uniref:hypothetical protein n=1 Tax=Salipiger aestuarii TaxID=568098 RepID=UPI00123AAF6D|nr:hypothetical protein [Salipiger aestuarii]